MSVLQNDARRTIGLLLVKLESLKLEPLPRHELLLTRHTLCDISMHSACFHEAMITGSTEATDGGISDALVQVANKPDDVMLWLS